VILEFYTFGWLLLLLLAGYYVVLDNWFVLCVILCYFVLDIVKIRYFRFLKRCVGRGVLQNWGV